MNSTPPPSSPAPSTSGFNAGTMLPPDPAAWQARVAAKALSPDRAYALARVADARLPEQTEIGYRVFWLDDRVRGSVDLTDAPEGFAVIGRHSQCDARLRESSAVSLRHVLVRATTLDDGAPVLRVLDLQTSRGFELADGSWQRSIAANGPVVFRIGAHSIVALPSSGTLPRDLPLAVVERGVAAPRRAAPLRLVHTREGSQPLSRITSLPRSVDLSSRPSIVPGEPSRAAAPLTPTGDGYEIILEGRGLRTGVELSKADLELGVLIGQSDKCVDARLRAVLSNTVSRVHALLLREAERVVLYDVASLNGTFAEHHRRIRSLEMDDAGTTVNLAGSTGVHLTFRAR